MNFINKWGINNLRKGENNKRKEHTRGVDHK